EEVEAGAEAAEDRISELPEALQLHILCLLPLKSAIRTGALSTRWRSLWTHRWPAPSSLDFHLGTHDSPHPLLETLERRRRRRLQRFALSFHIGKLKAEHFRRCLDYAAACAVEDLHVHLSNRVFNIFFDYRLPLGDPHLARLSLRAVTVDLPVSFSAHSHPFSALEVIHLHCVRISDRTVNRLVAACPLLHTLDLRYCESLLSVIVTAAGAHLRSLTLAECGSEAEVFLPAMRPACAHSTTAAPTFRPAASRPPPILLTFTSASEDLTAGGNCQDLIASCAQTGFNC
uniref:F-box domain-containing protein n=2 Tax=Triticum urartu TaxID=4572 RepID=A0A8R7R8L6_TRIUA